MTGTELRDLQHALELVYGHDQRDESKCLADKLEDLGYAGLRRQQIPGEVPLFPAASTVGLPKRRSA